MKHNVVPILDNGPLLVLIMSEHTKKEQIILCGTSGHFQDVIFVEVQVAASCATADREVKKKKKLKKNRGWAPKWLLKSPPPLITLCMPAAHRAA